LIIEIENKIRKKKKKSTNVSSINGRNSITGLLDSFTVSFDVCDVSAPGKGIPGWNCIVERLAEISNIPIVIRVI